MNLSECKFCLRITVCHSRFFGYAIHDNAHFLCLAGYPYFHCNVCLCLLLLCVKDRHLRCYFDAVPACIVHVKMAVRYCDKTHHAVQSAIKRKVCFLWVYGLVVRIVHPDFQCIFVFKHFCDIDAETGITSLMVCKLSAVHTHVCSHRCTIEFQIGFSAFFHFRFLERFHIFTGSSVIIIAAILSVYGIPGVRQCYFLSLSAVRIFVKCPVFIQ